MVLSYSSLYILYSLFDKAFLQVHHPTYYPTYCFYSQLHVMPLPMVLLHDWHLVDLHVMTGA